MAPVHLFDLVSRHNQWLSVRQTAIAGNIANANTPAFKALDVQPFEKVLDSTRLSMAATRQGHLTPGDSGPPTGEVQSENAWEVSHSGNSVSLEQELVKAGEVNRSYRLNAGVVKAFHRMLLASSKV